MRLTCLLTSICLFLPLLASAARRHRDFPGEVRRDVVYARHGGRAQKLDVFIPAGLTAPAPVVLNIHGGGFVGGNRKQVEPLCMAIAQRGMVVFNVAYRLAPWSRLPASIEDVRCALRFAEAHAAEYGGDPSRIGVVGESAGAYLASMLFLPPAEAFPCSCPNARAPLPAVQAAVLYYGVYDLAASYELPFPFIKPMLWLALGATPRRDRARYDRYNAAAVLPASLPRTLLLVGDADPLFPETRDLRERLIAAGLSVEMQTYPAAGHGFAVYLDDPPGGSNLRRAAQFLEKNLK